MIATWTAWSLAVGCNPEPTRTPPDTTPADSDSGPPVDTGAGLDVFVPFYARIVAFYGYDPDLDAAVTYRTSDGLSVSPQIQITLFENTFTLSGDYAADACGVVLTAPADTSLPSEPWTWTQGSTAHVHVGFTAAPGTLSVADLDNPAIGLVGCSTRVFPLDTYPAGLSGALDAVAWGFGLGATVDADLAASIASDPDLAELQADLDAGVLAGGSIRTSAEPPYDGRFLTYGLPTVDGAIVALAPPLTAAEMAPPTGKPAAGAYSLFRPDWIRTTDLLP